MGIGWALSFAGLSVEYAGVETDLTAFDELLFRIWREACRHGELAKSVGAITACLKEHLPIESLLVRSLDTSCNTVKTVAIGSASHLPYLPSPDTVGSVAKWERVTQWAGRGESIFSPSSRRTGDVRLLVPPEIEGDILAGPLVGESGPIGVLVVNATANRSFHPEHQQLFDELLEPISIALENHSQKSELMTFRQLRGSADRTSQTGISKSDAASEVIVGADSGLRRIMERVKLVSSSDVPVLILGETGTGKEVVSRAIHMRSRRAGGPFIRVNCGAIPSELLDSHLFGHERGSFTGAEATRLGWFERADGGTLFLDEIGELPPAAQVRLLRVLQDSFVERVGGQIPIRVDVRIIAATHRDLPTMVRERQFREDLWYRINVFPLLMPPLRDRPEDIGMLVRHFTRKAAERFGLPYTEPTPDDLLLMLQYRWPGNIRELAAVVDRAVILGEGERLDLAKAIGIGSSPVTPIAASNDATFYEVVPESPVVAPQVRSVQPQSSDMPLTLDEAMKRHIELVLDQVGGQIEGKKGAAQLLDINPHTLRARMRKLGVRWSAFRQ
ncbi:MAG TPA: Fis family transcriptional regulator [Planctomycetaceae bacterium]|nr:Fis family transcriptional regulator [Planctomycetaceae bacterium]